MAKGEKPIAWLHGELKTPPMSKEARIQGGWLLRRIQTGEKLSMPESRPLPRIDPRCHELRFSDSLGKIEWRLICYIGDGAIAVLDVFAKRSRETPEGVVAICKRRLAHFKLRDTP